MNTQASGNKISSINPHSNKVIAEIIKANESDYEKGMQLAEKAFKEWSTWPIPKRGDVVRDFGDALRKYKEALGSLISLEVGKIYSEGLGEV